MKFTVLAVSLALACVYVTAAEARPRHHIPDAGKMVGCSDPVMRPCETEFELRNSARGNHRKPNKNGHFLSNSDQKEITHHNTARPRAWCGWWLGRHLGMLDRKLWLARNWAHVGRPAHGPHVGTVVVWARGKRSGHVGIITGRTSKGWIVKSGNDGNAVRERVRSVSNAIAFRWP